MCPLEHECVFAVQGPGLKMLLISVLGRLTRKVNGKDKKKDCPSGEVVTVDTIEANAKSETLHALGNNSKKSGLNAIEVDIKYNEDETDGKPL